MIPFLSTAYHKFLLYGGMALGVILVLLRVRESGKQAERNNTMRRKLDEQKEIIRQDRVVARGSVSRMRERLSERLRNK